MQTAGMIIEYNPLHYGHLYLIRRIREQLGPETALVGVMSGNFVQRGDFALVRKHARAGAAVGSGVDLIISDGAGQWDSYQSGDFDINSSNWNTAATGDPCEYMNAWWGDCEADYCGYSNPEYNELFAKLEKTFDDAERKDIIQRLQQILLDDAAAFPLGYYNSSMISDNDKIGGAAINTADYYWVTTDIYPAA